MIKRAWVVNRWGLDYTTITHISRQEWPYCVVEGDVTDIGSERRTDDEVLALFRDVGQANDFAALRNGVLSARRT